MNQNNYKLNNPINLFKRSKLIENKSSNKILNLKTNI